MWCERLCVKEEGRSGGSELGSDLDLDPDPKKKLQIPIRQNDADPLDPNMDPQHWFQAVWRIRNDFDADPNFT